VLDQEVKYYNCCPLLIREYPIIMLRSLFSWYNGQHQFYHQEYDVDGSTYLSIVVQCEMLNQ
jgi:hypothetical protein